MIRWSSPELKLMCEERRGDGGSERESEVVFIGRFGLVWFGLTGVGFKWGLVKFQFRETVVRWRIASKGDRFRLKCV
jgi:hypothetical protein